MLPEFYVGLAYQPMANDKMFILWSLRDPFLLYHPHIPELLANTERVM